MPGMPGLGLMALTVHTGVRNCLSSLNLVDTQGLGSVGFNMWLKMVSV